MVPAKALGHFWEVSYCLWGNRHLCSLGSAPASQAAVMLQSASSIPSLSEFWNSFSFLLASSGCQKTGNITFSTKKIWFSASLAHGIKQAYIWYEYIVASQQKLLLCRSFGDLHRIYLVSKLSISSVPYIRLFLWCPLSLRNWRLYDHLSSVTLYFSFVKVLVDDSKMTNLR